MDELTESGFIMNKVKYLYGIYTRLATTVQTLHIVTVVDAKGRVASALVPVLSVHLTAPAFSLTVSDHALVHVYMPNGLPLDPTVRTKVEAMVSAYARTLLSSSGY
jgi:hypothetical protein